MREHRLSAILTQFHLTFFLILDLDLKDLAGLFLLGKRLFKLKKNMFQQLIHLNWSPSEIRFAEYLKYGHTKCYIFLYAIFFHFLITYHFICYICKLSIPMSVRSQQTLFSVGFNLSFSYSNSRFDVNKSTWSWSE